MQGIEFSRFLFTDSNSSAGHVPELLGVGTQVALHQCASVKLRCPLHNLIRVGVKPPRAKSGLQNQKLQMLKHYLQNKLACELLNTVP